MSLDFDFNNIDVDDYDELWQEVEPDRYQPVPVINAMIWYTMMVGIPEITEDNFDQFYARTRFLERLNGPVYKIRDDEDPESEPRHIKKEEMHPYIGLRTNASKLSKQKFVWRQINQFEDHNHKL